MPVKNRFAELLPEITEWRRDIHEHPELSNQEFRTARAPIQQMAADLIKGERAHFNQQIVTERVQAELRMLLETGRVQIPEQPDASLDLPADQWGAGLLSADPMAPDALAGAGGGQPGLSTEEPR